MLLHAERVLCWYSLYDFQQLLNLHPSDSSCCGTIPECKGRCKGVMHCRRMPSKGYRIPGLDSAAAETLQHLSCA